MAKLKKLLEDIYKDTDKPGKKEVAENVRNFGIVGKSLYNSGNILEMAKQLGDIADAAHHQVVSEQDDWFDKVSVNRNMKNLKGMVKEFRKTAIESHQLNQRLTGLYEDMGMVLNRYYEIDEENKLDKVDTDKVEPHDDYEDREDKDIDNDGDSDDSDKYIHGKRKAITKAVKSTKEGMESRKTVRLKDIANSVVGIGAVGGLGKKHS